MIDKKVISVKTLTELNEVYNNYENVIIDFYADWCGPCRVMAPRFESAAALITAVKFVKVNVDQVDQLKDKFQLSSIPTFIFMKQGQEIHRFSGSLAEDDFISLINNKFNHSN